VKELKIRSDKRGGRRGQRSPYPQRGRQNDQEEEGEEEEVKEPVMLRVSWRIQQIDYPTCLDYFILDYYDITYNESTFSKTINRKEQCVISVFIILLVRISVLNSSTFFATFSTFSPKIT